MSLSPFKEVVKKIKILNLFSGLGGNRQKWDGNIEVTAIELDPKIAEVYKRQFPGDTVLVCDAHEYLKNHYKEFDFIWSSPPCQKHSKMMLATRHDVADYIDLMLYQQIIFLKHFFKGQWVVENVKPYYTPLVTPQKEIGRHLFWSSFNITHFDSVNIKNFITSSSKSDIEKLKTWLNIHYDGNLYYGDNHCPGQVLRNCVHPDLGNHVFNCYLGKHEENNRKQLALF